MIEMRFIDIDEFNKYKTMDKQTMKVGQRFEDSLDFLEIIKQYMKKIVRECNEICQIGIYSDGNVVLYL